MRKKRLEARMGGTFDRTLEKVVAKIGDDEFTRRMLRDAKFTSPNGLKRVANRIKHLRPKGIRDLARQIDLEDLVALGGIRDMGINAFGEALELMGGDPDRWIDRTGPGEKVSAICGRLQRRKRKPGRPIRLIHSRSKTVAS